MWGVETLMFKQEISSTLFYGRYKGDTYRQSDKEKNEGARAHQCLVGTSDSLFSEPYLQNLQFSIHKYKSAHSHFADYRV